MSAPSARTSQGFMPLTVPAVPTGMNAGVRISPRDVFTVPVRARPSVNDSSNISEMTTALWSGLYRHLPSMWYLKSNRSDNTRITTVMTLPIATAESARIENVTSSIVTFPIFHSHSHSIT